jgi:hypothetical protein
MDAVGRPSRFDLGMDAWARWPPRLRFGVVLVLAAAAYWVAAGALPPGFYDGFAPQPSYRWVSPPPQFRTGNQPPASRHAVVSVDRNGVVGGESLITADSQLQFRFARGAFLTPPGGSPLVVDIRPVARYPSPGPVRLSTNVYCITANSTLRPGKTAVVTLTYSSGVPQPGSVYAYRGTGPWRRLPPSESAVPFTIAAVTDTLGCFAAGSTASASGGGPGLAPAVVVLLAIVAVVVLAGLPLLVLRGRG